MNPPRHQTGMTLVELMISILAGVVVIFAVTNLLVGTLSGNTTNMRYTRMNQDLRSTLEAMAKDVTRAGEWALADDVVHMANVAELALSGTSGTVTATARNPATAADENVFGFTNAANALTGRTVVLLLTNAGVTTRYNIQIAGRPSASTLSLTIPGGVTLPTNRILRGGWIVLNPFAGVTVNGNCILSSYDINGNGQQDSNERFGFRLQGTAIETSSNATACDQGTWQDFTDSAFLSISAFNITQVRRSVTATNQISTDLDHYLLDLTGALVAEAAATRTVQQAVKVRNNRYY